jgi:hypothetical protein
MAGRSQNQAGTEFSAEPAMLTAFGWRNRLEWVRTSSERARPADPPGGSARLGSATRWVRIGGEDPVAWCTRDRALAVSRRVVGRLPSWRVVASAEQRSSEAAVPASGTTLALLVGGSSRPARCGGGCVLRYARSGAVHPGSLLRAVSRLCPATGHCARYAQRGRSRILP